MRKKIEIKSGDKYGRLTIIAEVEPYLYANGGTKRKFSCLCECGKIKDIRLSHLKSKNTISCGCYQKQKTIESKTIHGFYNHYLYKIWAGMIQRCNNTNSHKYSIYGGRGIKVCDRWLNSFQNFLVDMGERPEGTSIDRIDNDGNYEPSNCRWATSEQQNNNKRKYYGKENSEQQ